MLHQIKICSKCKIPKPVGEFYKNSCRSDGVCNECKACSSRRSKLWNTINREHRSMVGHNWYVKNKERLSELSRKWRQSNPEKILSYTLKHSLKRYGLTPKDFEQLISSQSGKCAVCKVTFTKISPPCVDHCHKTGTVRGLLCKKCNFMLGLANDSPSLLKAASNYLLTAPRFCGILT